MKAQISLRKCAGWSGPSLSADCIRALFVRCTLNASGVDSDKHLITIDLFCHSVGVFFFLKLDFDREGIKLQGLGVHFLMETAFLFINNYLSSCIGINL